MSRALRLGFVSAMLTAYAALAAGAVALGNPAEIGYTLPLSVAFAACPAVGGLIILRRPENRIGWLFCGMGLAFVVATFAESYSFSALRSGWPGIQQAAWLSQWVWLMFIAPGLFLFLVFPSGRLPSRRWNLPLAAAIAAVAVVAVGQALGPTTLEVQVIDTDGGADAYRTIPNPYRAPAGLAPALVIAAEAANIALIASTCLLALAMVVRFRRSRGIERLQLKWFVAAAAVIGLLIPTSVFLGGDLADAGWVVAMTAIGAGLPIAAGIAILRHRLYDIDLVIRRTLIYGALVAILAAVYTGLVLGLQTLLSGLTGGETLPVALSTLAIVALFGPVRGRVRALVDRRFYRSAYDAGRTVDAFAARLRDEVDLDALVTELQAATRSTVRPASASVWLRETGS